MITPALGGLREEVEFELSQSIDSQDSVKQGEKSKSNPGRRSSVSKGVGAVWGAHLEEASQQAGFATAGHDCKEDRTSDHQKKKGFPRSSSTISFYR